MLLRAKCDLEKLRASTLAKMLAWGIETGSMTPWLDMSCAVGLSRFYAATRGLLAPLKTEHDDQNDAEGLALTMRAETKAQTSASATAAPNPVWRRVGRSTSFAARSRRRRVPRHLVDARRRGQACVFSRDGLYRLPSAGLPAPVHDIVNSGLDGRSAAGRDEHPIHHGLG